MSARDVSGPITPSAQQHIHIYMCTKLRLQVTLRKKFGEQNLAKVNASITPLILALIFEHLSLYKYISILL